MFLVVRSEDDSGHIIDDIRTCQPLGRNLIGKDVTRADAIVCDVFQACVDHVVHERSIISIRAGVEMPRSKPRKDIAELNGAAVPGIGRGRGDNA